MLQFLRPGKAGTTKSEFHVISGGEALRFFSRQTLYALLLVYSTVFLAVAIPYRGTYFIGGLISAMALIRLVNFIVKYNRFRGGRIALEGGSFEVWDRDEGYKIPSDSLTYAEINVLGNLVLREKYHVTSFPVKLLTKNDQQALLSRFEDMSPRRTEIFRKVWDFFDAVLVAFILAMHIRQYIVQAYYIPTGSMEDTLQVGDHLLVEKITYGPVIPRMIGMRKSVHLEFLGIRPIRRGDILIFRPPGEEEKDFIKRCIAVEGDEYHIREGRVWVGGKYLDEPYVKGITSYRGFSDRKIEGIVPAGMIIAMGDNRENSYDSRGFGYLPLERVKGKALVLYWNTRQIMNLDFSRLGLIK